MAGLFHARYDGAMDDHLKKDWIAELERGVNCYEVKKIWTALEFESFAINIMPCGGAAEMITRLPVEIALRVRSYVIEITSIPESKRQFVTISGGIPGPGGQSESTDVEQREYRQKLEELRWYFEASSKPKP
jgi:hypothetical protein